ALVSLLGNLAADAAYVVLIPLAAVLYAAAGRHPIAGVAASFAGVSGGVSGNLLPGQLDAMLFGITQAAAVLIDPEWTPNIAGNWYFISFMTCAFLPVIWFVTDRVIEPRLPAFRGNAEATMSATTIEGTSAQERRGLLRAGWAALAVALLWLALCVMPGAPLVDLGAGASSLQPFYQSLVAAFFVLFLACGWAYGSATGSVNSHRDVVRMMS